jgi:hypothetical protein
MAKFIVREFANFNGLNEATWSTAADMAVLESASRDPSAVLACIGVRHEINRHQGNRGGLRPLDGNFGKLNSDLRKKPFNLFCSD